MPREVMHYRLSELNAKVRNVIETQLPQSFWLVAEISEVNEHPTGHCYLELVEKEEVGGNLLAKARGNIWARTYRMLKPYFETTTGDRLRAGMKVLLRVKVSFHETFGFALTIFDMDPTYTLGDLARRRMEILKQLKEDGVFDMNKGLQVPLLPQRIAIISSASAAGYQDFVRQLHENNRSYVFYTKLFAAHMQGKHAESLVLEALHKIHEYIDCFDVVVLVRGGGSVTDLSAFDSYELGSHIAQFPLPVIVGIGHDKDETVIDQVAHTSVKTPTAAAAFLLNIVQAVDEEIIRMQHFLKQRTPNYLQNCKESLVQKGMKLPLLLNRRLRDEQIGFGNYEHRLKEKIAQTLLRKYARLDQYKSALKESVRFYLSRSTQKMELLNKTLILLDPKEVLKRGFSLTTVNGRKVLCTKDVKAGEEMVSYLKDGMIKSIVVPNEKGQDD